MYISNEFEDVLTWKRALIQIKTIIVDLIMPTIFILIFFFYFKEKNIQEIFDNK